MSRTDWLIIWNTVLTTAFVLLLIVFLTRPEPSVFANLAAAQQELSIESDYAPVIEKITLTDVRQREQLTRFSYDLTFPVKPGWVSTVWQNGQAVVSRIAAEDSLFRQTIQLYFGENAIRVAAWNGNQELVYEDYFSLDYSNPLIEALRRSVERGRSDRPSVSLTFDGGAISEGAHEILDILEEEKLITTMFITGRFIENYPELVLRMVADGHELANHTYDHPHLTTFAENGRHHLHKGVSREFLQKQLLRTDSLFQSLVGKPMISFWRAPYGEYNQEILDWAAELGYLHISWSRGFDTLDWVDDTESSLYRLPDDVYKSIISRPAEALNGAIILMHLGSSRQSMQMFTVLSATIRQLRERGFDLVKITDLLKR